MIHSEGGKLIKMHIFIKNYCECIITLSTFYRFMADLLVHTDTWAPAAQANALARLTVVNQH